MSSMSHLDIYRRMFSMPKDGLAAYWYLGAMSVAVEPYPVIPVLQVETLMIYKTTTLSPVQFRMDWWEIGVMRDPVTGEIPQVWTNPITGAKISPPKSFEEGPASFTVTQVGNGLKVDLVQAHAQILGVEVQIEHVQDRVFMRQTERKIRGFPRPDGSLPNPGEPGSVQAQTQLAVWADATALEADDYPFSSGAYEFKLGVPDWMGFGDRPGVCLTRGVMTKAAMNETLNPTAWVRLQQIFPQRFEGDEVRPVWA